ncbi:MAG TPA: tetratricopeptide repeat protein [Aliidongia sp.]|uniref:tetratricopeptide repeat protein n=1 Tax=Aliidongia sp. TaxID=1914230 RepID=UPI002DDDAF4C|nr:tetratricopeptide repeat protein [Aliidongia sp.]HEV2673078.1 tetratricopeptide repeat protein [Aliidongia sp.]
MVHDCRGLEVTAADAAAVMAFDRAIEAVLGHRTDAGAAIEECFSADAEMVLGWVLRGAANLLLAKRECIPIARDALLRAERSLALRGGTARERLLTAALGAWVDGSMRTAADRIDEALQLNPLDGFALKLGHGIKFMLGDLVGMRRSLAHALPHWRADVPGCGYVLGCHAFVLEESGDLLQAEREGRRALELAPRDVWGAHAVTHVFEMQGRARDGIAWLAAQSAQLPGVNNFAYHMYWHRALFHLALGETDPVLDLYDAAIRAVRTDDYRDVANAVSMLWRLEAQGVAVGHRWDELGDLADARGADPTLAFAMAHRGLALVASGRLDRLTQLIGELGQWAARSATCQAGVLRMIGLPLLHAIAAEAAGHPDQAVDILFPIRHRLQSLGGSHAQRDLFLWFLTDAAIAAGRRTEAFELLADRTDRHATTDWAADRLTGLATMAA